MWRAHLVYTLGLSSWAAKKQFLSAVNKAKRLQWVKTHQSWTFELASVLFTDDNSFPINQSPPAAPRRAGAQPVTTTAGDRLAPEGSPHQR